MHLAIIIVNYRTPVLVVDCLHSLVAEVESQPDTTVIVVDNNSGDDSVDVIEKEIKDRNWSRWARCICSERNDGFSSGNNIGIRSVQATYYLLLNSDTLVCQGTLIGILNAAESHKSAGIVGPRLTWEDGSPQVSAFRHHSPISEFMRAANTTLIYNMLKNWRVPVGECNDSIFVEWVSFACVLIRADVIKSVGELDEGFFMYFEDADYCRRARAANWKILHYPFAKVVHLRGGTSPVKSLLAKRRRRPSYYYESRSRYLNKCYGVMGLWAANIAWIIGRVILFIPERIGLKNRASCEYEFSDIWKGSLLALKSKKEYDR